MIAAKLPVPLTNCSAGEPSFLLGEDEVESDSGVSGSELNEGAERLGSVGEGDLDSGGDGCRGTQTYQAKDALSRRTLNFSPVSFFTALSYSSFSILTVMLCPPFPSF